MYHYQPMTKYRCLHVLSRRIQPTISSDTIIDCYRTLICKNVPGCGILETEITAGLGGTAVAIIFRTGKALDWPESVPLPRSPCAPSPLVDLAPTAELIGAKSTHS